VLITLLLWFFTTSTKAVGAGKDHPKAAKTLFIVKSTAYWLAVVLSFCVGMYVKS